MSTSSNNQISILQWNLNGFHARLGELQNYLSTTLKPPHIICLQETKVRSNKIIKINGYNIERKERSGSLSGHGGLVIAIKVGLTYSVVDTPTDSETQTITFKVNNVLYSLLNIYMPPSSTRVTNHLTEIVNSIQTTHNIILGDFNAHNHLWGSVHTDPRGIEIESFLDTNNLCVLNDGSPTYQHHNGTTSQIDLSITSANISLSTGWQVLPDSMGSDHFPILITLNNAITVLEPQHIEHYVTKKADWLTFKSAAGEAFQSVFLTDDTDEESYYGQIKEAILTAANQSIPVHKPKTNQRHKPVPYWTSKCKRAVETRAAAATAARRLKTTEACIEHRRQRALCQKTIRAEKQQSWQDYCDTLTNTSKLTSVWRMAKSMKGDSKPTSLPTLRHNNITYETSKEKADLFADKFSKISSLGNHSSSFKHKTRYKSFTWRKQADKAEQTGHQMDSPMEMHELQAAISQSKRGSAPGQDKISYEMLKNLPKTALHKILNLFNSLWSKGRLISEWKHSIVIPIKKPGSSAHSVDSYRPIALTAALCKTMERIVNNRLIWYLESNHLLNAVQAGFRSNRSTIDQLLRLHTDASNSIKNKSNTLAIFLDFSKAFDLMWHEGLMYKLREKGITGNTYNFIKHFLQDRTIQVRVGASLSDVHKINMGTPQGSVLSPLLFLIYVSDFPENAKAHIQTSLFADDSAIWKSGGNIKFLHKTLQAHLNVVSTWCDEWGFIINIKKTVSILFTHRRVTNLEIPFIINNSPIAHEQTCRFLGMQFDTRLTWNNHINYIIEHTKGRVNLIRMLSGQSWGCSKMATLTVYRSLIRSVLEYGCELFSTATSKSLKKLDVLQAKCLRICCGAMRCTPHASLQNECGELPLALRRTEILMRHCVRITANTDNPSNIALQDNWYNYIPNTSQGINHVLRPISHMIDNVCKVEVPSTPPWLLHYPTTDSSLSKSIDKKNQSPVEQLALAKEYMETWSDHIPLFTDGSKAEHKTACAFHYQGVSHSWRLVDDSSVYGAELHAIKHGIQYLLSTNASNTKFVIFSDSLSAVQALSNTKINKNDTFINSILDASNQLHINGNSLVIAWIPSHVGIQGNEFADVAAKHGLSLPLPLGTQESTVNDCYAEIARFIDAEWQQKYDKNLKIAQYKLLEPLVNRRAKFAIAGRSLDRVMTRLRLGYCLTNSILNLYRRISSPNCSHCNVEEDLQHFVFCPANNLCLGIPSNNLHHLLSNICHLEILARNIIATGRRI